MDIFDIALLIIAALAASAVLTLLVIVLRKWANALVSTDDFSGTANIADGADESEMTIDIPWQAPVFGTMAPAERYALMMRSTAPVMHVVNAGKGERRQGAAES